MPSQGSATTHGSQPSSSSRFPRPLCCRFKELEGAPRYACLFAVSTPELFGSTSHFVPTYLGMQKIQENMCGIQTTWKFTEVFKTFIFSPFHQVFPFYQDDSSTSPSPNKLHKSPWVKMRDIIQTHRESVKKKSRPVKGSPDVVPARRRSFSDGADSDAPPALTLTIPSSEELGTNLIINIKYPYNRF